jgi:hypothetical protein
VTGRKPQKGDLIRVTYEGRYLKDLEDGWHKVEVANYAYPMYPREATVEVLEPADDPSKDLLGTVRREDHEAGHSVWQCVIVPTNHNWRRWECVWSTAPGNIGSFLSHETVAASGFPVVGTVPGTPAADLDAERKLDEIPEWKHQLLAEQEADECTFLDTSKCVIHGRSREPRVFQSDGPEPAEDVACVEWLYGSRSSINFLQRNKDGWSWVAEPGGQPEFSESPLYWCPAGIGQFREVIA